MLRTEEHNRKIKESNIVTGLNKWKKSFITSGVKFCECGCGEMVYGDNRNIKGHGQRHQTKETKIKRKNALIKFYTSSASATTKKIQSIKRFNYWNNLSDEKHEALSVLNRK